MDSVTDCQKCELRNGCKSPVAGEGSLKAKVMFIGEAPGAEEDEQGKPFVGKSGKILDKAISFAELTREQVYITNVVKCRPPDNKTPTEEDCFVCGAWLKEELFTVKPKIVVTLGKLSSEFIVGQPVKITECHGDIQELMVIKIPELMSDRGFVSMATGFDDWLRDYGIIARWIPFLHPAWLLRGYTEEKKEQYKKGLEALKEAVDNLA